MRISTDFFARIRTLLSNLSSFYLLLYACGYYANGTLAAVIGLVCVMRRMVYFRGYTDPESSGEWALPWVCLPKFYWFDYPPPNSLGAGNVGYGLANV